jgi:hypothetical protein
MLSKAIAKAYSRGTSGLRGIGMPAGYLTQAEWMLLSSGDVAHLVESRPFKMFVQGQLSPRKWSRRILVANQEASVGKWGRLDSHIIDLLATWQAFLLACESHFFLVWSVWE